MSMVISILFPIISGIFIYFVKENRLRHILTGGVLFINIIPVIYTVLFGGDSIRLFSIYKSLGVVLFCDRVSGVFALLFSIIWAFVSLFAFWYMAHGEDEARFFLVYTVSLGTLLGLAFSENLITYYMFFEMMTIITVIMVLHERTLQAYNAGFTYLGYSVFGAGMVMMGIVFMNTYCDGVLSFTPGGNLSPEVINGREGEVLTIIFLMIVGFGAKAGMFPLHSWLPVAHPVAPAPASAVLSGLITKAGVLGIIRVCFFVTGVEIIRGTWVQKTLLIISLLTVFLGSMIAYKTDLLKKRLAYSSVSQVSYALFGIFLFTDEGLSAAFLQIVFHAISKNILFVLVGAIIVVTGKTGAGEVKGIAKKMPVTIIVFALAALNLIGIPPMGGFFSKWNLAVAALKADLGVISYLGPVVLLVSAILTAGYLLPIVIDAWLKEGEDV